MKKVTEDKNDVIRFLEKLYIGILENNIKVPDECHIEISYWNYIPLISLEHPFIKFKYLENQK